MIEFKTLYQIRKDAVSSIKSDSDGSTISGCWPNTIYFLALYLLPILSSIVPFLATVRLSDMESFIGVGVSIFTGLFFSLLLNISAKIRIEKENKNIDNDNFRRFKNNMKQISNITQYVIILGILIMLLVLFYHLLNFGNDWIKKIFTSMVCIMLLRYFSCMFFLLQRFHFVLRDEVDNII